MNTISVEQIYQWRDSQRSPDLKNDIAQIIQTFDSEEVFSNTRAYIDYLCTFYGFHEDFERDTCQVLVKKNGVYKHLLLEAFLEFVGGQDDLDDFHLNGISESSFFDYINMYKDIDMKRELQYRFLKCYEINLLHQDLFNFDTKQFEKLLTKNLTIPKDFKSSYLKIAEELFKNVCTIISKQ